MFLVYERPELIVQGYTDSSFQYDRDNYKSQSGYMFMLNGAIVSWKSFKQEMTADSTMKVEYIVASDAIKEAIWIKKFITELGTTPSIVDPVSLL